MILYEVPETTLNEELARLEAFKRTSGPNDSTYSLGAIHALKWLMTRVGKPSDRLESHGAFVEGLGG